MSIATELNNLKTHLASAYTKAGEKGATIPADKNMQNLASTIDTITGGVDPPQYTYREMPQEYQYYKELKSSASDNAFLCHTGACGYLCFQTVPSSTTYNCTIIIYGGTNGQTPLYRWVSSQGWYHYFNNAWVKNATQPSSLYFCKTYEMDLDNYPLPVGTLFKDLTGKPINDEKLGQTGLITVVVSGNYKVPLSSITPYGYASTYPNAPVFAYSGNIENFRANDNIRTYDLEFVDCVEGPTSVPSYCFSHCNELQYIKLPSTVTAIESYAFQESRRLEKVETDGEIERVASNCFQNCTQLKYVDVSHLTRMEAYAFNNCIFLNKIELGSGLTEIPNYAFSHCLSLSEIEIPEGITSIGPYAFQQCYNLQKITLPSTLLGLGTYCLSETKLEELVIPDSVVSIPASLLYNCNSINKVTIGARTTTIDNQAFNGCYSLQEINLPQTVTTLSSSVFSACYSLRELVMPSGVKSLGVSLFSNCWSLKNVTLPSNITSVGTNFMSNCRSLEKIELPATIPGISSSMFSNCGTLREIIIPASVLTIAASSFGNCGSLVMFKLLSSTPPALENTSAFSSPNNYMKILIPYEAYDSYQTATNWSSSTNSIKMRQRGYGTFAAGTTLPTTLGTHILSWYDLPTILNTTSGNKPTSGQITVAPEDGEYYCFYE